MTRKWYTFSDQLKTNYDVRNEIIYNTKVVKSNFCDYSDAHILVRDDITIIRCNTATGGTFKNYAPFTKCITKVGGTITDDAENLDLVMPMYSLIGYNSNYSNMTDSYLFIHTMKLLILLNILPTLMLLNLWSIRLN